MSINLWLQHPEAYYLKVENSGTEKETLVAVKRCRSISDFFSSKECFCTVFDLLFHRDAYRFDRVIKHVKDNGDKYKDINFLSFINSVVTGKYNPKHEKAAITPVQIDSSEFIPQSKQSIQELKEKKLAWRYPEEFTGDLGRGLLQEASVDVKKLIDVLKMIEQESLPYAERKELLTELLNNFSLTKEKLMNVLDLAKGHSEPVWRWRVEGCSMILRIIQKFETLESLQNY